MLLAAFLTFLLASVLYYHARFLYASLVGIVLAGMLGMLLFETFSTTTAVILTIPLLVLPALVVIVHAIDARRGIFLLPTVYGIVIAFFGATLCLLVTATTQLLRSL